MHMSTLIMWHNRFSENENEAVEAHIPRHRVPIPKNRHIEIPRPKNRDIEKRRQITHGIVIPEDKKPRHRDSKAEKPRHRDSKTKKTQHRDSKTKKPRHRAPVEF